eukprot:303980-Chlamydomonas_euryale.AAC.19
MGGARVSAKSPGDRVGASAAHLSAHVQAWGKVGGESITVPAGSCGLTQTRSVTSGTCKHGQPNLFSPVFPQQVHVMQLDHFRGRQAM